MDRQYFDYNFIIFNLNFDFDFDFLNFILVIGMK
jgi:hypothetical protein